MREILAIAVCGAIGALARAGISAWLVDRPLPWGTLLVNVLGCFVLGLITGLALADTGLPEAWRKPVATGFLGSLTTFSTFGVETVRLLETSSWQLALANVVVQLVLGLGAAALGLFLARLLTS